MQLESPENWKDYELIDSGGFEKLERFGSFILARPEPKALWNKSLSQKEWDSLSHTKFVTGAGFGKQGKEESGTWKMLKKMPEQWSIKYNIAADKQLAFRLGLTSFKHVGLFPEQAPNWNFIYKTTRELVEESRKGKREIPKILNLFAYTGAASLAAKAAGADVTHLDSVRQVVTWAKQNMELSRLENIRWVVEDALKFVIREAKRGRLYNGVMLDPPAYGHGPDGEKWKLDELLFELLTECAKIVAPENSFALLNLYSNGYSALLADTAVREAFKIKQREKNNCTLECGELVLRDNFGKAIPLSVFSRLRR